MRIAVLVLSGLCFLGEVGGADTSSGEVTSVDLSSEKAAATDSDTGSSDGGGVVTLVDPAESSGAVVTLVDPAESSGAVVTLVDPAESSGAVVTLVDPAESSGAVVTLVDPAESTNVTTGKLYSEAAVEEKEDEDEDEDEDEEDEATDSDTGSSDAVSGLVRLSSFASVDDFTAAYQTALANAVASTVNVSSHQVSVSGILSVDRRALTDRRLAPLSAELSSSCLDIAYVVRGLTPAAASTAAATLGRISLSTLASTLSSSMAAEGLLAYSGTVTSITAKSSLFPMIVNEDPSVRDSCGGAEPLAPPSTVVPPTAPPLTVVPAGVDPARPTVKPVLHALPATEVPDTVKAAAAAPVTPTAVPQVREVPAQAMPPSNAASGMGSIKIKVSEDWCDQDTGTRCVYPFVFNGVVSTTCTYEANMCATEVGPDGIYLAGSFCQKCEGAWVLSIGCTIRWIQ
jgi:hypothetical protein